MTPDSGGEFRVAGEQRLGEWRVEMQEDMEDLEQEMLARGGDLNVRIAG